MAIVNYVDFITDVLVMLEYGCFLNNNLTTSCDGVEGCEAHWWWFGLALSILIISSLVQSFYYSGDCGSCGLCCLSLLQLSYLRDLCVALGGEEDTEENRRVMIRDVIVKMLESAPQLYLQSYILFVIGEHRNHLKLISIMFSALSLAVGVSKFVMWQFEDTRLLPKVALALFLTSDQLMRAAAYALVLSEAARFLGLPLVLLFGLLAWMLRFRADGAEGGCQLANLGAPMLTGVVAGHLVPILTLQARMRPKAVLSNQISEIDLRLNGSDCWKKLYIYWSLPLRFVEILIYAILGLTVAERRCGFPPHKEVIVVFGLLGANLLILLTLCCFTFEPEKRLVATVPVVVVGRSKG